MGKLYRTRLDCPARPEARLNLLLLLLLLLHLLPIPPMEMGGLLPSFLFLSALSTPPLVAPRPGAARRARAPRVWGRRIFDISGVVMGDCGGAKPYADIMLPSLPPAGWRVSTYVAFASCIFASLSLCSSWLASLRPLARARLEERLESWCLFR